MILSVRLCSETASNFMLEIIDKITYQYFFSFCSHSRGLSYAEIGCDMAKIFCCYEENLISKGSHCVRSVDNSATVC